MVKITKSITVVQQHCKNRNKPQLGAKVMNERNSQLFGSSPLRKHCSKYASRLGADNNWVSHLAALLGNNVNNSPWAKGQHRLEHWAVAHRNILGRNSYCDCIDTV